MSNGNFLAGTFGTVNSKTGNDIRRRHKIIGIYSNQCFDSLTNSNLGEVHFDNVEKNSVYAEDENNYTRLNCKIPGPFICIRITGYSTIGPYATVKDD